MVFKKASETKDRQEKRVSRSAKTTGGVPRIILQKGVSKSNGTKAY
ncbi:hypothetical protein [Proteiniphilum sp.]|nr:hypothetical protein [Proteiniphilum sp.]MEA4917116.1 hypothetical protein [Proteiniphilum sp.]